MLVDSPVEPCIRNGIRGIVNRYRHVVNMPVARVIGGIECYVECAGIIENIPGSDPVQYLRSAIVEGPVVVNYSHIVGTEGAVQC